MYEIIPSKLWRHANGILTASIYGSCPWTSEADKANWTLTTEGYTVRNTRTGTVGTGRKPFPTIEAVQEWIDAHCLDATKYEAKAGDEDSFSNLD